MTECEHIFTKMDERKYYLFGTWMKCVKCNFVFVEKKQGYVGHLVNNFKKEE